jgi:hypothetical protein
MADRIDSLVTCEFSFLALWRSNRVLDSTDMMKDDGVSACTGHNFIRLFDCEMEFGTTGASCYN